MGLNRLIRLVVFVFLVMLAMPCLSQDHGLVDTDGSPFARLHSVGLTDVSWTKGFWAERFNVCEKSMVPHMMSIYMNDSISHGFANFEIAAGLKKGVHVGPPFHDGDFYKMLEALIMVYAVNRDEKLGDEIDSVIAVIGKSQRPDGYVHTPVVIEEQNDKNAKNEFARKLDFETYNMGHLMTTACVHYRVTGKKNLLNIAIKATDFLYEYYKRNPEKLAQNAVCPSHYMGVAEMYRTTRDPRYLELAKGLIDIRSLVKDGTDHNQDRIPFRQQTQAVGHAVRANYLYAGVADVYAETGDPGLMEALNAIWEDVAERKVYITGACGALYDGVSPNGTTYDQPSIQQVHQAYGQDYELPNLTAHNESCANIGNLMWNWRMFLVTGDAKYTDMMERVMYNSLLAGVSLDGERYFYTNPLAVSSGLPYKLRWSKDREEYISYCNCCPPNTIRTIAEIRDYMYSISQEGLWVNFYGGNRLSTMLPGNKPLEIEQVTDYPWSGKVRLTVGKAPAGNFSLFLRIPGWCTDAKISINGKIEVKAIKSGSYAEIKRNWKPGDMVDLELPMNVQLIEANPLVEATRNQVAVQRGPVVYCLESVDLPARVSLSEIALPSGDKLHPVKKTIAGSELVCLTGQADKIPDNGWNKQLYRPVPDKKSEPVSVTFIPYYAWDNRGACDMGVWVSWVH